ncbi:transcriptional repressor XBP1 [Ceratobasidium sp. AG-Ba]|nr:transcriptional repressor XBP1 [Ceratobasidium sp. AG-Ba]
MSPEIPAHTLPQTGPPSAMIPEPTAYQPQRYQPYSTLQHRITKGRYITSNDPRGYVPVYEYPLNGQWIMMDVDDGYVLWTGIWKALGNTKADIVKMLESQPDLAPQLRRVRGGYLKIQGTWMPFEVALRLARRVAWPIREDLVPLFGPTFPSTCLSPDQPGYGQVVATSGKRKSRRPVQAPVVPIQTAPNNPRPSMPYQPAEPPMYAHPQVPRRISGEISDSAYGYPVHENYRPASSPSYPQQAAYDRSYDRYHQDAPSYHHGYGDRPRTGQREAGSGSPVRDRHSHHARYSPYPSASRREYTSSYGTYGPPSEYEYPPSTQGLHSRSSDSNLRRVDPHERLTLPPISALAPNLPSPRGAFTLPPLVTPTMSSSRSDVNSSGVPYLGRMRLNSADDNEDIPRPSEAYLQQRRSSSAPPLHLAPSRYPPPPRSGDRLDGARTRPSWSFGSSDKSSTPYDRDPRPDTRRSDTFAWSSVRGGPSTSPPPSASNSTHGAMSTNEHSPISPRTPYGWESSRAAPPALASRGGDHPAIRHGSPRERSVSPEITVAQEYDEDRHSTLEVSRRESSPTHSRKSSGHGSNETETIQASRAPLRPW